MERRKKYLSDIKVIVHSMRDNMRKQRMNIRRETQSMKNDLIHSQTQEDSTEVLAEKGRRYIKEVGRKGNCCSFCSSW